MHNTILCLCILLPPIYHDAGLVLCIRDRCNTSVSLCIAASKISVYVFVTGAIPFCVAVQCIVMSPLYHDAGLVMCIRDRCDTILCLRPVCIGVANISRCRTGYEYSGQVQYHSVSKYSVYCWFCVFVTDAIPFYVVVQCILLPPISGYVYSGQAQHYSVS